MLDEDFLPPSVGRSRASSARDWGLAALVIGCTLLIAATVMMVFTILLEQSSLVLRPRILAVVGMVPMVLVLFFGVCGFFFAVRARREAEGYGETSALGFAGALASVIGIAAWLTASIYLGVVFTMK